MHAIVSLCLLECVKAGFANTLAISTLVGQSLLFSLQVTKGSGMKTALNAHFAVVQHSKQLKGAVQ